MVDIDRRGGDENGSSQPPCQIPTGPANAIIDIVRLEASRYKTEELATT
ncbi:hypothetical protein [Humibacter sp.]|jgi:hypothetical protein|nr:hypothetical protein [Humibacter sp.]HVX07888.1 hypothetical protein [Humibacter sp.]